MKWHWLKEEAGNSVVVFAIAAVALFGFASLAVDYGATAMTVTQEQAAVDAGALAGAKEWGRNADDPNAKSKAEAAAVQYAEENDATGKMTFTSTGTETVVTPPGGGDPYTLRKITVSASAPSENFFSLLLGAQSEELNRQATAAVNPAGGVYNSVPLSIDKDTMDSMLEAGEMQMNLKVGAGAGEQGFYGTLDPDNAGGANVLRDRLMFGYQGYLESGDIVGVENGNMKGPVSSAVESRIQQCEENCPGHGTCTAEHFDSNCPRVIYVPIITKVGNKQVQVKGFAPFFLDGMAGNTGKTAYVKGTFLKGLVVEGTSGVSANDYGLYTVNLVE